MPKSKYPQELDTSVEIPPVRDNILEIGSDVINSLRSAIFNIERVLGINPQGAVGNSLAERLNRSLDGNGNIKSDALDRANVLSGPIVDADVSRMAAIQESKLKLEYPTTLLQEEISMLNSSLDSLTTKVDELSVELSVHLNDYAINRHKASAISVKTATVAPQDIAFDSLSDSDVQAVLENIVNGHINYSGADVSSTNNSHTASQVYFDNSNITAFVTEDDVQGAVEELASIASNSQANHQKLFHSNGILTIGEIDTAAVLGVGNVLDEDFAITFVKNIGSASNTATVSVDGVIPIGTFNLKKSDILTITDSSNPTASYVGDYEIESFITASGLITDISVYGYFGDDSTSLTRGRISKNIQVETNLASLLTTVREEAALTSAPSIQICNPNSVKVISSGIRPYEITTTKRYIGISLDGNTAETIDMYNGSATIQTIDSIVSRINEQAAQNASNFMAYRVDYEDKQSELVIAHNLADEEADTHTITISRKTDNGIDAAGFGSVENDIISSDFGTNYFIKGQPFEGLKVKINSSTLNFNAAETTVSSGSSGIDFLESGIKIQDILIITDATNSSDDGTYVIEGVTASELTLSSDQLPSGFAGTSQSSTKFRIYSNIVSFENFVFDEVGSGFGSVLSDVFINENQEVFIDKRFEYTVPLLGSSPLLTLVDFEGEIADKEFDLVISSGTDLVNISLDGGDTIQIRGDNSYAWITSGTENVRLKLMIPSVGNINTQITTSGSNITTTFFGFDGNNSNSNLLISRVAFNNFNSRIAGGEESPRARPIIARGNISIDDISNSAKEIIINRPIDDLRSNGVVYGLEITNAGRTSSLYSFNVERGVCYVNGKRIEVEAETTFISDVNSTTVDKVFIAIDEDGMIRVEKCTPSCECPFETSEYCLLATLEFDNTTVYNIDLRLFIDEIDLKLLNSITVSPQKGMGHFSDFGSAVKYAKRFNDHFPQAGTPTIHLKSGNYDINVDIDRSSITYSDWTALSSAVVNTELFNALYTAGLIIDFPVNIVGEGDTSVLKLRSRYTFSNVTYSFRGVLTTLGVGSTSFTAPIDKFSSGFITYKNFRMDNCRIAFVDFNINDGTNDYYMGATVDSVTFNMRDFTANPTDVSLGPRCVTLTEVDDVTLNKGNLTINNCTFIVTTAASTKSVIILPEPARAKNIIVSNNRLLGATSSSNVRLLSEDIWSFTTATSGSNISIVGNLPASNFIDVGSANAPDIAIDANGWGDRISRSLRVGGLLTAESSFSAGGTGTFTGDVTSTGFNYSSTMTRTRNIFFDTLSVTALGDTGSGTSFGTLSVNGRTWRTVEFADNTTDYMIVRLDVRSGETLDDVVVVFGTADPADSIFGGWLLRVESEDAYGDSTVHQVYTSMGGVTGGLGSLNEAAFVQTTNLGFTGANNKNFLIKLRRVVTTGYNQHVLYIQYTTTMTEVQAIGGLT